MTDVVERLPALKADAMTFTLQGVTKNIIDLKINALLERTNFIAAASAACAVLPILGLSIAFDATLITKEFTHYKQQLDVTRLINPNGRLMTGPNAARLEEIAKELKAEINKAYVFAFVKNLCATSAPLGMALASEEFSRLVLPIIGSIFVGAGASFYSMRFILRKRINGLGNYAKEYIELCSLED